MSKVASVETMTAPVVRRSFSDARCVAAAAERFSSDGDGSSKPSIARGPATRGVGVVLRRCSGSTSGSPMRRVTARSAGAVGTSGGKPGMAAAALRSRRGRGSAGFLTAERTSARSLRSSSHPEMEMPVASSSPMSSMAESRT
jgi:hypothetical protein